MKKIVIIGPESTGKSTLCQKLADHYQTVWCPEFARTYLQKTKGGYTYDDLLSIAKGQLELEDKLLQQAKNGFYFIDTDMYVMKVWGEVVYQQCDKWILKQIAKRKYDFYLLCQTDLLWQADELREYPNLKFRQMLFKMYKDCLIHSSIAWAEVSGSDEERFQSALAIIEETFSLIS